MRGLFLALVASTSVYAYKNAYLDERELVNIVNYNINSKWRAEKSTYFANHTIAQVSAMLKTSVSEFAPHIETDNQNNFDHQPLPTTFDARKQWPGCVHNVRNQEQCGSCWAFGASEVLSDRFCIAGVDRGNFSPQNLVSCDKKCYGCNGGTLPGAWNYLRDTGIVSDKCQPYVSGNGKTGHCSHKCSDGSEPHYFKAKDSYPVVGYLDVLLGQAPSKIKAEVYKNGPVEVAFIVFQDFMSYKGGVYHHVTGPNVGGHAVKLIGWTENAWIIQNSWGPDWGEEGTFRIRMGTNECGIETNVYAGRPDMTSV